MFATVAAIGGLDVQLVYYRGQECVASRWLTEAHALAGLMSKVMCYAGTTQIARVLVHARKEHQAQKVNALIVVSDACEEPPGTLFDLAGALGDLPVFMQSARNVRPDETRDPGAALSVRLGTQMFEAERSRSCRASCGALQASHFWRSRNWSSGDAD
jgi:hypothetical protein